MCEEEYRSTVKGFVVKTQEIGDFPLSLEIDRRIGRQKLWKKKKNAEDFNQLT